MTMLQFELSLGPGRILMRVNGHDIENVEEVHIHKDNRLSLPIVQLVLGAGQVSLDGTGIVESIGTDTEQILESLDAEEIEQEALRQASGFNAPLVPLIVEIIKEKVRGGD